MTVLLVFEHEARAQGTICLWRLAAQVAMVARTESVRRRARRAMRSGVLCSAAWKRLIGSPKSSELRRKV